MKVIWTKISETIQISSTVILQLYFLSCFLFYLSLENISRWKSFDNLLTGVCKLNILNHYWQYGLKPGPTYWVCPHWTRQLRDTKGGCSSYWVSQKPLILQEQITPNILVPQNLREVSQYSGVIRQPGNLMILTLEARQSLMTPH